MARGGRLIDTHISPARRWAITMSVMMVTVMQVLDTSVTNVALPHMQGSFSASIEEMSWVVTSFLAANAIIIPATGWLSARFGRRRLTPFPARESLSTSGCDKSQCRKAVTSHRTPEKPQI